MKSSIAKPLLLPIFFIILCATNCKKETPLGDFYFRCKLNGQDYIPNNCANCNQCDFLGDTTFFLGGNRGFEAIAVGYNDLNGIKEGSYLLAIFMNPKGGNGIYKNSTLTDDIYKTDSFRSGKLEIKSMNKVNKIITGTFYFKAYNDYTKDEVNITQGKFRLKYNDH